MNPRKKMALYGGFAALGFVLGLVGSGCIDSTVICSENLKACGTTCADVSSDKANCGGCGIACAVGQVCQEGACVCEPGTEACDGVCAVTQADPRNCGACGNACPDGQVCEAGACQTACTLGTSTLCGDACVDTQTDAQNCGACGNACDTAQSCHQGVCSHDVIAACFNLGQLRGVQSGPELLGALTPVGTHPFLLAGTPPVALVADTDGTLRQVRLNDLSEVGTGLSLGTDPEGLLSVPPYVYAIDDASNALTIFRGPDAGTLQGGYPLTSVGGFVLGDNSGARTPALLDGVLYVPLFGNLYGGVPGTKVARVDVSDPANPRDAGTVDLSGLDLKSPDGGTAHPQPAAVAAFNGKVYVALSNLNDAYSPQGPGLLAKIDPADGGVSEIDLGGDACLSPFALIPVGDKLVVSCSGASDFSNFPEITTTKTGLVLLGADDQRVDVYTPSCDGQPADAGCADPSLGHLAAVGQRVYAADQTAGRLFVVDVADAGFTEVKGYGVDGGPLQVCVGADGGTGGQLVSDVAAVP